MKVGFAIALSCFASSLGLAAELPADAAEAGAALAPFKRNLMSALTEGLTRGPENALDVCHVQAPGIATAAGSPVMEVGRASHKLRNPANAPRDWVKPLLDAYLSNPADRAPKLVDLPGGAKGYVEPIVLQPMCTTCHGTAVAAPLKAKIDALYPTDQATGFAPGDFRGLFWVEFRSR